MKKVNKKKINKKFISILELVFNEISLLEVIKNVESLTFSEIFNNSDLDEINL